MLNKSLSQLRKMHEGLQILKGFGLFPSLEALCPTARRPTILQPFLLHDQPPTLGTHMHPFFL